MSSAADRRSSTDTGALDDPPLSASISAPAGVVVVPFVLGILIDRATSPGWGFWTASAIGSLMLAMTFKRRSPGPATILLLAGCLTVGGMRHHLSWSARSADDVSLLAGDTPAPIRVVGVVHTPPTILAADESELTPPWMRIDRSVCELTCEQILAPDRSLPVSGTARLTVTGHLLHVNVGDRVHVVGRLVRPGRPSNPGGFDFRDYLRRQRVRCVIGCDHPDAVRIVAPRVSRRIARTRTRLRDECESVLVRHLRPETVSLARSLLLGQRSQLPDEVRTDFAESGTMHLLAISGLHVGILAALLLFGCRLLNVSVPTTTFVVLTGIGAYAFVTNLRPPVVRASVLAVVVAAAWPDYRRVSGLNLIAVCALVVLLIDPTDLFDVGTQLSFLAVVAIGWAAAFVERQRRRLDTDSLLPRLLAEGEGCAAALRRVLVEGYVVTAAIWTVTLPLTIAQFHIAAPVGFLINVLLIPYVALLLALGFLTIGCGLLLPAATAWPAMLFDAALGGLLGIVDSASSLQIGRQYLGGPPQWWLVGFYGLLGAALLFRTRSAVIRWGWTAVWSWVVVGLCTGFLPPSRETFRCTFLNMGHGCCVILDLPEGETLLYDAGLLGNQKRGQQIVEAALWERSVRRIDGIIVSHADVDHFNVAAPLMTTVPTGTLLAHRTFLDFGQPAVDALIETASRQRVPIRLIQAGDRLLTDDPRVSLEVLRPAHDWKGESDNSNSVVLRVRFAGRSLLLAGDLEGTGLAELLDRPPQPVDVLLAPHHGSLNANPTTLAEWAAPEIVIVSGGDADTRSRLRTVYVDAEQIFCTRQDGAVTVEITSAGEMTVTPFANTQ